MEPKYKITVNKHKCVGSTLCVDFAPAIFGLDREKQARIVDEHTRDLAAILSAAESCPMSAITVHDTETGERLFP